MKSDFIWMDGELVPFEQATVQQGAGLYPEQNLVKKAPAFPYRGYPHQLTLSRLQPL